MPIPRPDPRFSSVLAPPKKWAKVVDIFRKVLTDEVSGKTNTKMVGSLQGHMEDVCTISRSETKKRRGHSPGNTFVFFYVNQPVSQTNCYTPETLLPAINSSYPD